MLVGMKQNKFTVKQFNAQFPDDTACLEFIFKTRYPDGGKCTCGKIDCFYPVTGRRSYACSHCGNQISPCAGTIFHKSETSLKSWFFAMFLMSSSKNGVAAKELERQLGVTYKTAWRMAHQIRKLMDSPAGMLNGVVEADETYIGGKARNMHAVTRKAKGIQTGTSSKVAVLGLVEREGSVRATVVDDVKMETVIPNIVDNVAEGSTICTDELTSYNPLCHVGYVHARVNHRQGEYVRAEVHTNSIEGFWSQLKRSINGTFHHVSKKHLQKYVNEFCYRYNRRKVERPIFSELSGRVAEQHV
jgi:transposase-like protein